MELVEAKWLVDGERLEMVGSQWDAVRREFVGVE